MSRFEFDCFVCDERLVTSDIAQLRVSMERHKDCGTEPQAGAPSPTLDPKGGV